MTQKPTEVASDELRRALDGSAASQRLQAALTAGMNPNPGYVDVLIEQCAVEIDFYVRDMLTWALIRHDATSIVDRLLGELGSGVPQARSQALHTLSKIGDPRTWPAITVDLLQDTDDEVARTAWRTAAGVVPEGQESVLAKVLATQFGRGDRDVQLSLSRVFAMLGPAVSRVVDEAAKNSNDEVRTHALATARIMQDPTIGFDAAIAETKRTVALLGAPLADE